MYQGRRGVKLGATSNEGTKVRVGVLDKGILMRFPKVRTGRPDHGRTRHFGNEIGVFQEEKTSLFVHNI